uniref:Zf-AD domain-containing protein n=1 Tax=Anopheles quadriannulatus TaxID=34691 RepID=A0A182X221_ANOQN
MRDGSEHPCRVCLAEGARNIFNTNTIDDEMCTVASINHIRHKLQYVTQLQVNEDDGLPFWICDLCVVQLNVAYHFKMVASESDSVLRRRLKDTESPSNVTRDAFASQQTQSINPDQPAIKQEPASDIELGPVTVCENDYVPPPEEARNELVVTPNETDKISGMVCVQKNLLNPAEDEAYLKNILENKVIDIPWEAISDGGATKDQQTLSTATPTVNQSHSQGKPVKKLGQKKRNRSRLENQQSVSSSKKVKRTPKEGTMKGQRIPGTGTEASSQPVDDKHGATPMENTKLPSKAALRQRRLQKVLESLRIDMVDDKLVNRYGLMQDMPQVMPPLALPSNLMKRRNSICVSSFSQWL